MASPTLTKMRRTLSLLLVAGLYLSAVLLYGKTSFRSTSSSSSTVGASPEEEYFDLPASFGYALADPKEPTELYSAVTRLLLKVLRFRHGLAKRPAPLAPQPFAFEAAFGDNMVLQHGSKASIYGFLGPTCIGVQLDMLTNGTQLVYSTKIALINATQQPFGKGWGVRPCSKADCPPYDMQPFNPWNQPLPTWKVLLRAQKPGGNYTIQVTCRAQEHSFHKERDDDAASASSENMQKRPIRDPETIRISNVTFGDMWYCSGQSNMMLPLKFAFNRNETAKAIVHDKKYHNIRIMAGGSQHQPHGDKSSWSPGKYGAKGGSNQWMQAFDTVDSNELQKSPLFSFGAACWYFGQKLVDEGVDIPIGLANTAIGGQRIQEYMDNSTISTCHNRSSSGGGVEKLYWEGQLFATQVLPFVDMTVKGWLWYQGENNMHDVKGNSKVNIGYGCEMKTLIHQWRRIWSLTPGTTNPDAPFGIVTLASSGDEGGPDMGAMRYAQTANYGVLPHEGDLPNTFIAQAYDLDDEWGPETGPCFANSCCEFKKHHYDPKVCTNETLRSLCHQQPGGCTAAKNTPSFMGGIHPRSKKQVGDRLAMAAFNLVYGGKEAFTGPTLQGCSVPEKDILEIRFNKTLLRGDSIAAPVIPPPMLKPGRWPRPVGGSQLWVQTNASQFCMESSLIYDGAGTKKPRYFCPSWAGGTREQQKTPVDAPYKDGWIQLNFTLAPGTTNAIHVDLSVLPEGTSPTAVRYAWGLVDCCDYTDPTLYVTHGCIACSPLKATKSQLPANPFQARIVDGKCECVAPQACLDEEIDAADFRGWIMMPIASLSCSHRK